MSSSPSFSRYFLSMVMGSLRKSWYKAGWHLEEHNPAKGFPLQMFMWQATDQMQWPSKVQRFAEGIRRGTTKPLITEHALQSYSSIDFVLCTYAKFLKCRLSFYNTFSIIPAWYICGMQRCGSIACQCANRSALPLEKIYWEMKGYCAF